MSKTKRIWWYNWGIFSLTSVIYMWFAETQQCSQSTFIFNYDPFNNTRYRVPSGLLCSNSKNFSLTSAWLLYQFRFRLQSTNTRTEFIRWLRTWNKTFLGYISAELNHIQFDTYMKYVYNIFDYALRFRSTTKIEWGIV